MDSGVLVDRLGGRPNAGRRIEAFVAALNSHFGTVGRDCGKAPATVGGRYKG